MLEVPDYIDQDFRDPFLQAVNLFLDATATYLAIRSNEGHLLHDGITRFYYDRVTALYSAFPLAIF